MIRVQGPSDMVGLDMENDPEFPGRKKRSFTWTPTKDDASEYGEVHKVYFDALDNNGSVFYSSFLCCYYVCLFFVLT